MPVLTADEYYDFLIETKAKHAAGDPDAATVLAAQGSFYPTIVQNAFLHGARTFDLTVHVNKFSDHVPGLRRWVKEDANTKLCIIFQGAVAEAAHLAGTHFKRPIDDGQAQFFHTDVTGIPSMMVSDDLHTCYRSADRSSVIIAFNRAELKAIAFQRFYDLMKSASALKIA